jgi:6-phosphofructokinase 1
MYTFDQVTITEAMGRNTGWIAAATGLARRAENEAPNLIYVPEIPVSTDRIISDVRDVYKRLGRCFIVVSEGAKNEKGEYLAAQAEVDQFGHRQLGGAADFLRQLISSELGVKARYNRLDTCQRNAVHFASKTDSDEAWQTGQEAVRQALQGVSGVMITLRRESDEPYRCRIATAPLAAVANQVKHLPRDYMNAAGTHISDAMRRYVAPLMRGEVAIDMGPDGLPVFARLQRRPIARRLPAFAE